MAKRQQLRFELPTTERVRENYAALIGQIELLNKEIKQLEEDQSDILTEAALSPIYDSLLFEKYADNRGRLNYLLLERDGIRSKKSDMLVYEHLDKLYTLYNRVIEIENGVLIHRPDLDGTSELSEGELIALRTIAEFEAYNYDEDMESLDVYGLYKVTVQDRTVTMVPIKLKTEILEDL